MGGYLRPGALLDRDARLRVFWKNGSHAIAEMPGTLIPA
jgi:hypothetical protein